jgi:hypothetical protein
MLLASRAMLGLTAALREAEAQGDQKSSAALNAYLITK